VRAWPSLGDAVPTLRGQGEAPGRAPGDGELEGMEGGQDEDRKVPSTAGRRGASRRRAGGVPRDGGPEGCLATAAGGSLRRRAGACEDRGVGPRAVLSHEEVWRRYDAVEDRVTAGVSERMLDLAGVGAGTRALDLATGRGEPAIRAAKRAGADGGVVGVEPSEALVRMAGEKAAREGVSNLEIAVGEAESVDWSRWGVFDAATARWGLMYMRDPVAALKNAKSAIVPGGALVAALWAEPERVDYFTVPRRSLGRYRGLPEIDPEAPGTFRFADMERIRRDFERAGWALDHVEEVETPVFEATTSEMVVEWARALGLTRLLNELSEEAQRAWERDFAAEMEGRREEGVIRIGGVTRIVRARGA